MGLKWALFGSLFYTLIVLLNWGAFNFGLSQAQSAMLNVDASSKSARVMPDTLFGIFFEVKT
jgi:hypothetical protein